VFFNVSLGDHSNSLPDFRGYTLFDLADFLDKTYIDSKVPYSFETPIYEFNDNVEKGRIIRQEPSDGTPLKQVKKVKLWISNGIKDNTEKTLPNFVGKTFNEILKTLEELEIYYSINFNIVNEKKNNMVITEQSIGEGALISELIEENKVLILSVNIYKELNGEKIEGFLPIKIPKKPLAFNFEAKIKTAKDTKEKSIFNMKSKGGVDISLPYYQKENSIIYIYHNNKLEKELVVKKELEEK